MQRHARVFTEHLTEKFKTALLQERLDGLDAEGHDPKGEVRDGQ